MLSYQQLTEKYKNLFDKEEKEKYAVEVFNLLTTSYKKIGGLKGTGFKNPTDMVNTIPFWKLGFTNGELMAVIMYKDKGQGRKLVAAGCAKSKEGSKKLKDIFKSEFSRSYAEISDPLLSWIVRQFPSIYKKYRIDANTAKKIIGDDSVAVIDKYFYVRSIGGSDHTKLMIGTVGKKIS